MSQPYQKFISDHIDYILQETHLDSPNRKVGKVRDSYTLDDSIVLVTTDRQSAFDRNLASIPFKGAVLNLISAYWFDLTKDIIPNHLISIPHPNVTIAKKVKIFPVEFVVRAYLTGSTSTSAWVNYSNGIRDFCGNNLPEKMVKNQKFEAPIITPTTKSDQHDELISGKEIVRQGLMSQQDWNYVSTKALELFIFATTKALGHNLILVDTKLEFGKLEDGTIVIADEMFTPDSSRYWIADTYNEKFVAGQNPDNIDKEFLRLWFIAHCDPYSDKELPVAPKDLIVELSGKYIQLFEMITNHNFPFPDVSISVEEEIKRSLKSV